MNGLSFQGIPNSEPKISGLFFGEEQPKPDTGVDIGKERLPGDFVPPDDDYMGEFPVSKENK